MSYIALARKWRPRTFSELLGQEHLVRALTQSLIQNRVHHAYLFTGTRGVGKTSVARIFAKALNCLQGISAEPCLQCDNCQAIEQGRFIDLIEIDAASKTRVEDTRELLDNVPYAPSIGRYKIYLIDEVHMLSQHSFNALLKTLEEPPAHVKFLLATTDVQKLPITILSRCLQFHLKHVSESVIATHLQAILQSEATKFDPHAVTLIAKAARGSMRDALSLLDQSLAGQINGLVAENVAQLLGQSTADYALQLIQALSAHDPENILRISRQIAQTGDQFRYVLEELLVYLHRITVVHALPNTPDYIESQADIVTFAQQLSPEDTQLFYQIGLKGLNDLSYAPSVQIGFEMTVLRMYTFKPAPAAVMPKLAYQQPVPSNAQTPALESEPVDTTMPPAFALPLEVEDVPEIATPAELYSEIESTFSASPPPQSNPAPLLTAQDWATLIPQLQLTGLAYSALQQTELLEKTAEKIILKVGKSHQSIFTKPVVARIQESLSMHFQEPLQIILQYQNELLEASPAAQKQAADTQQHAVYTQALHDDPMFQQLQKEFGADLLPDSITTA